MVSATLHDDLAQACRIASFASIAGCVIIIGLYLRFAKLRKHFARLVVYLTISDFWFCMANTFGPYKTRQSGCYVQAMFVTYFGLASILWTGAITYSLQLIVEDCHAFSEREIEPYFLKMCWGIPLILTLLTMILVDFTPTGYWCWIDDSSLGDFLRLVNFYIPLWVTVGYNTWVHHRLGKRINQLLVLEVANTRKSENEVAPTESDQQKALWRLLLFPMVLAFCWTAASINRIATFIWPDFSWYMLDYLMVVTGSMQGFMNAIVYGTTIAVREAVIDVLHDVISNMRHDVKRWRRKDRAMVYNQNNLRKKGGSADISPVAIGKEGAGTSLEMYELGDDDEHRDVTVKRKKVVNFNPKSHRGDAI